MASIHIETIQLLTKRFVALPVALLLSSALHAQEPDTAVISRAMAKYPHENAVITHYEQKLELNYEEGELTATSHIKKERLLIGELSPSQHNFDYIYDGYFDQLTAFNAVAYIPQKNGGFRRNDKFFTGSAGTGSGISDSRYMVAEFTGLTKGSFIRLTATQEHPDMVAMPDFYAQDEYPIMHEVFEVTAPNWVDIKFAMKGENTSIIKQTREEKNGKVVYRFTADNVPAVKRFENVPSALYYVPHVLCYIASYRLPGQQKDSVILRDADNFYRTQYKFFNSLNLKEDTGIKKIVDNITKGDVTQRQKAAHIYDWVQKNIHYVAFEIGLGGWVPREADTVFKKKYGDCKDMSSLLVKMGRLAGLETYFTIIGTTLKPYTFEETPVMNNCNHAICALRLDGEWLFMDATHSELPFGANRDDIQGKEAMIIMDRKNYKIVTIPVVSADKNTTTTTTSIHISDKNYADIEGTFKQKYTGYGAWNTAGMLAYYTKEKDEREKVVSKLVAMGSDKFILDKYDVKISDTGRKEMSLSGNFSVGNYVNKIDKDYIVNMNLNRAFEENYIDTSYGRKIAWYNRYKQTEKEVVTLDVPEGYKVSYLPKNAQGRLNDLWSYSITYKNEGKKVTLVKEYTMNAMKINPDLFIANNKAIKELEKQYKETVVLSAK